MGSFRDLPREFSGGSSDLALGSTMIRLIFLQSILDSLKTTGSWLVSGPRLKICNLLF